MPRKRLNKPPHDNIYSQPGYQDKIVKSAGRVFQILELFDSIRMGTSAVVVSGLTGIPQSSTSILLRSMVALGYLDHDTKRRTYIPNNRVALLGSWVDPQFVRDGPVIGMMKEICEATDHNVVLVTPNRLLVQVAHAIPSRKSGQPYIAVSSAGSILHTATGHALLSLFSDEEIAHLVRRYNAERGAAASVDHRALLDKIRRTRSEGYALQVNESASDGWVMAMPLPVFSDKKLFAIGVGAFASEVTIDPRTVLRIVRKAIRNWLDRAERSDHGA